MSSTVDEAVPSQESGVQSTPKKSRMILFIFIAMVALVVLGAFITLMFTNSSSQLETITNLKDSQNLSNAEYSPNDPLKSPADNGSPANNLLIFGRTFQKPPVRYIIVCAVLFVLVVAGICALIAYKVYSAQLLQQQELLRQQQQEAAARANETPAPFNFFHQLFFKSSALPKLLIAFALLCQVLLIALPYLIDYFKLASSTRARDSLLIEALLVSTLLTGLWQLGAFANLSVALLFQTPATHWLIAAAIAWILSALMYLHDSFYNPDGDEGNSYISNIYFFLHLLIIPLTIGGLCAIGGLGAFFGVLVLTVSLIIRMLVLYFLNRERVGSLKIKLLTVAIMLNLAVLLYFIIGSLVFSQVTSVIPFILSLLGTIFSVAYFGIIHFKNIPEEEGKKLMSEASLIVGGMVSEDELRKLVNQ